ncbi:nucleotidyltransferase [Spirochaetia bacterium]|nr:nucleotidyltransferase [Spirochaetia bacterium]
MKGPILVVLAAGLGSRYGGLKQMDKIGNNGEALLDYSVYDAVRSGFKKVVFIIRHYFEEDFKNLILKRIGSSVDCELAFQELDTKVPAVIFEAAERAGRTKPWGTAHALLCVKEKIDAPFAILNADDFYGLEAFNAMGAFLKNDGAAEGAIVPYQLEKTLSPQGTVTRGVCKIKDDYLVSVDELKSIEKKDAVIYNTNSDGSRELLEPDTPVSMNFWGFPPAVFPDLERYFGDFLKTSGSEPKSECYLPLAADWLVKNRLLPIRVLKADSPWFGVTYKEDREAAVKRVSELTAGGMYPPSLWKP